MEDRWISPKQLCLVNSDFQDLKFMLLSDLWSESTEVDE